MYENLIGVINPLFFFSSQEIRPESEVEDVNATHQYFDFVQLAIGQLAPDEDLAKFGRTCRKIAVADFQGSSCQEFQKALKDPSVEKVNVTCTRDELVFDHSIVTSTVTQDYDLTCDHSFVRSIFNSLYLGGMLVGSFVIGLVSDRFGRLKALVLSIFLVGGSGLVAAFVQNRIIFALLRITTGMGGMGSFMVPAVIAAEATLPDYKIYTTMCSGFGFVIGELVFALEAYHIRDWITLQLVAYTPMLILLGLYFIFPESTRWLIAKGKIEEAKDNIARRASVNSVAPVPEELYEVTDRGLISHQKTPTIMDLFKPKEVLFRSLNMFLQWFSVTMGYYGLLFASTGLGGGGDPHKTFTLAVLAELPALFIYLKLPQLFGRKVILIACQLICGICCIIGGLLVGVPSLSTLQLILVMIGRLSAALGFGMVYLYTSELFPTAIRSTAIGTCSCMARVGGIIAILMNGNLDAIWPPLVFVIFGAVATTAGILAFRFPETTNDKLPETMDEAMNLGKNITRNKLGIIQKP